MKHLRLVLLALFCQVAIALPPVQVVLTVPLETNLGVPGALDSQKVWLDMIGDAKNTLDLEQFYVSDQAGEPLAPVLAAIQEAGKRGVKVRLLVDSKFYQTYPDSVKQIGATANSEARTIDYSTYGGVQHAKFFVVDGKDSFAGSQNFDWRALEHIHEVGLRVTDTVIASDLTKIFQKDWSEGVVVSHGPITSQPVTNPIADERDSDLTVVASPAVANPSGIGYTGDAVLGLMKSAKKTIRIQVMEYTTKAASNGKANWKYLNDAVVAAAKRGVNVQLMVDISDVKKGKADLTALSKLANVEVRTVTIPQFSGGVIPFARLIHSKYLVADGADSWVGSENWSEGYFLNTRDVGFVIHSGQVADTLTQIFDKVWQSAYATRFGATTQGS